MLYGHDSYDLMGVIERDFIDECCIVLSTLFSYNLKKKIILHINMDTCVK